MVELKTYVPQKETAIHVETLEVERGQAGRLFLTERLEVLVCCNVDNDAGQVTPHGDFDDIVDFALCYKDASSGDLVKIEDLDPEKAHVFGANDIIRLRYKVDDVFEELRLVLNLQAQNPSFSIPPKSVTTQRIRLIARYS